MPRSSRSRARTSRKRTRTRRSRRRSTRHPTKIGFAIRYGDRLYNQLLDAIDMNDFWMMDKIARVDFDQYKHTFSEAQRQRFYDLFAYVDKHVPWPDWWEDRDPENPMHNPRGYGL